MVAAFLWNNVESSDKKAIYPHICIHILGTIVVQVRGISLEHHRNYLCCSSFLRNIIGSICKNCFFLLLKDIYIVSDFSDNFETSESLSFSIRIPELIVSIKSFQKVNQNTKSIFIVFKVAVYLIDLSYHILQNFLFEIQIVLSKTIYFFVE